MCVSRLEDDQGTGQWSSRPQAPVLRNNNLAQIPAPSPGPGPGSLKDI